MNSPNDAYKSIYSESPYSTNTSLEYPITYKGLQGINPMGICVPGADYYIHNWRYPSDLNHQTLTSVSG